MQNEITTRVVVTLLQELINSAKRGSPIFQQWGIDKSTMADLSSMNASEIHELAETPFINHDINARVLNITVQKILHRRNREDLYNDAISHGATRNIMAEYAKMSQKEFKKRREDLNMGDARNRPNILNDNEYDQLADLHSKFNKHYPINERLDHLRCLVHLSESTSLDISRIYQYFYIEQKEVFDKGGNDEKD